MPIHSFGDSRVFVTNINDAGGGGGGDVTDSLFETATELRGEPENPFPSNEVGAAVIASIAGDFDTKVGSIDESTSDNIFGRLDEAFDAILDNLSIIAALDEPGPDTLGKASDALASLTNDLVDKVGATTPSVADNIFGRLDEALDKLNESLATLNGGAATLTIGSAADELAVATAGIVAKFPTLQEDPMFDDVTAALSGFISQVGTNTATAIEPGSTSAADLSEITAQVGTIYAEIAALRLAVSGKIGITNPNTVTLENLFDQIIAALPNE